MTAHIAVVGSLNMDLIVRAEHIPQPGETIIGGNFICAAGGKGANQAVAAARLGANVQMVGRIGDDAHGAALRRSLEAAGVDTQMIQVSAGVPTGVALITVADSGDNSIVVSPGANWQLTADDVAGAEAVIGAADMLLLQLEVQPGVVEAAIGVARRHGVPVVLNPAPAKMLAPELLRQVDYLIPNESEAALLSGRETSDLATVQAAAAELSAGGIDTVIVTLGGRGAYLFAEDVDEHVPAFAVDARDTTGAGDAFVAAFAVAVSSGKGLLEAVRLATAAGALTTTRPGAQPSLPGAAEVQQFLAEQPRQGRATQGSQARFRRK